MENKLLRDTNGCRDALTLSELIRKILQRGMAESRDRDTRGYGDHRDGLFAERMRFQVPPGLARAGGDPDGEGDGDMGGDVGGGPGGGGGDDDKVDVRNNQVVEPDDFKDYPYIFKNSLGIQIGRAHV